MMQNGTEHSNNVVSLRAFGKGKTAESSAKSESQPEIPREELFAETMRKNEEARRRLAQDRAKANRSVLKSYRIKT